MLLRLWRTGLCPDPEFIALGFPGRGGALTRKGNATQRVSLPTKPRIDAYVAFRRCIILRSGVQNTFIGTPSSSLSVFNGAVTLLNLAGDAAQSQRNRCSIRAVLVHSWSGISIVAAAEIQPHIT